MIEIKKYIIIIIQKVYYKLKHSDLSLKSKIPVSNGEQRIVLKLKSWICEQQLFLTHKY